MTAIARATLIVLYVSFSDFCMWMIRSASIALFVALSVAPADASGFKIRDIDIAGNELVSDDDLDKPLSSFIGQDITMDRLANIRATLFDIYTKSGFLAQVKLPPQSFEEGVLRVDITELRLGDVTVNAPDDLRYAPGRAASRIEGPLKRDTALAIADLDFQTQALDSLNGVVADSKVTIDQANAEIDVELTMQNTSLFEGSFQVDNFGSASTGQNRATIDLQANSLFHYGERFVLSGVKTKHLDTKSGDLELPVGPYGGVIVAGLEQSSYAIGDQMIVLGQPKDYVVDGNSTKSWIRYRAPERTYTSLPLSVEYGAEGSSVKDGFYWADQSAATASPTTDKSSYKLYGQAAFSWVNEQSTAAADVSVQLAVGKTDLALGRAADADGANVHGTFAKLTGTLSGQYRMSGKASLSTNTSCQIGSKNLDTGEKFELSGATAVRSYAIGAVNVNDGCYAQNEFIYQRDEQTALFSFADVGAGRLWGSTFTNALEAGQKNSFAIGGIGFGVRYNPTENINVSLTHARRIGTCSGCVEAQASSQTWAAFTVNF